MRSGWHEYTRDHVVLSAIPTCIHKWNEPPLRTPVLIPVPLRVGGWVGQTTELHIAIVERRASTCYLYDWLKRRGGMPARDGHQAGRRVTSSIHTTKLPLYAMLPPCLLPPSNSWDPMGPMAFPWEWEWEQKYGNWNKAIGMGMGMFFLLVTYSSAVCNCFCTVICSGSSWLELMNYTCM